MDDESDTDSEDGDGAVKAQDFHTILEEILKSFVELQETGFMWDLVYKVSILDAVFGARYLRFAYGKHCICPLFAGTGYVFGCC